MATLAKHAKRGKDKDLGVTKFYTSAWSNLGVAHLRFQNDNGDLAFSAQFSMVEAAEIARHFSNYVRKYGSIETAALLDEPA